jgi:hypothetical protein
MRIRTLDMRTLDILLYEHIYYSMSTHIAVLRANSSAVLPSRSGCVRTCVCGYIAL